MLFTGPCVTFVFLSIQIRKLWVVINTEATQPCFIWLVRKMTKGYLGVKNECPWSLLEECTQKPVFNYVARNVCIRKQQKPNCLASQFLEWIDIFYIWHREGRVQSKRQSYLARYRNKHVSYQERWRQPGPWDSCFLAMKLLFRRHFQYVCVEWPSHCVQLVNQVHGCRPRRQLCLHSVGRSEVDHSGGSSAAQYFPLSLAVFQLGPSAGHWGFVFLV